MAADEELGVQFRELVDAQVQDFSGDMQKALGHLVKRFAEAELSVGINFNFKELWGRSQDPTEAGGRDRFADRAYKDVVLGGRVLDAAFPLPNGEHWYDNIQVRALGVVEQMPITHGGNGNTVAA